MSRKVFDSSYTLIQNNSYREFYLVVVEPIRSTELVTQLVQENLSINQVSAPIMDVLDIRASIPGFEAFRSPTDGGF